MNRLLALLPVLLLPALAAAQPLADAQATLDELNRSGYAVSALADLLATARASNGTAAEAALAQFELRVQRLERIADSLTALSLRIEALQAKLNTTEAEQLRVAGLAAFAQETYDEAEAAVFQANQRLTEEEAEARTLAALLKAGRENAVSFARDHLAELAASTAAALALLLLLFLLVTRRATRKQIAHAETERRVLRELMKRAQVARYREGALSEERYRIKMEKYREQLQAAERRLPVLRSRLRNPFKRLPSQ